MPSFETPCPHSARRAVMVLLACAIGATIGGCTSRGEPVQIRFRLADASQPQRVRFYVHTIELLSQEGSWDTVRIDAQLPWQSSHLALIDLDSKQGSAGRNAVTGHARRPSYAGVRFTVGVPFDLNHANPLTATAPLDRPDMFWTWQSGYKFLRIDLSSVEHEAAFHLGSTGCSSASALRPPAQACAQPNVLHVELTGFDPMKQAIQVNTLDVAKALDIAGRLACTGEYDMQACRTVFETTGLDLDSGTCVQRGTSSAGDDERAVCRSQRLFSVAVIQSAI